MRKTHEQLQELMEKENADRLWSWSKVNSYKIDPYSYLLKYIEKIEPDKNINAYAFFGGIVHDLLEQFYDGKVTNKDMIEEFDIKTTIQELGGIRFDGNQDRNETIGEKYITCIKHFLNEYEKDEGAKLEQFVYGKIGNHLFQGYIDKMHVVDNILYIDDFKTSTMYTGKKVDNEKGQLLLYAILINEMFPNITFDRIKIRWNFLKYVAIDCQQVNGNITTMYAERNKICDKLEAKMKTWLKKEGIKTEDLESYIEKVRHDNVIEYKDKHCLDSLPENVKNKFVIRDCIIDIEINDEDINSFIIEINNRCNQIIEKEKLYHDTKNDKLFWVNVDKNNFFYFGNLCDYSAQYHKPLREYYEEWDKMQIKSTDISQQEAINNFIFGQ